MENKQTLEQNTNLETVYDVLSELQTDIRVNKDKLVQFKGTRYSYRTLEDIYSVLKDHLGKYKVSITFKETIQCFGDDRYIQSECYLHYKGESVSGTGFAREERNKSGMNAEQATLSVISFARRAAISGLFLISGTEEEQLAAKENQEKAQQPVNGHAQQYRNQNMRYGNHRNNQNFGNTKQQQANKVTPQNQGQAVPNNLPEQVEQQKTDLKNTQEFQNVAKEGTSEVKASQKPASEKKAKEEALERGLIAITHLGYTEEQVEEFRKMDITRALGILRDIVNNRIVGEEYADYVSAMEGQANN